MRIARMRLFGLGALLVALLAPAASAQSALDQMQDAINQAASETLTSTQQSLDSIAPETPDLNYADALAPAGSVAKLKFLQEVQKTKKIDPAKIFDEMMKSNAFGKILDNVEIQHRILENIPALKSIAGFNEIQGRRLSDAETTAGFAKGLQALADVIKTGVAVMKDPTIVNQKLVELAKSDDPDIQALFQSNDEASVRQIRNLASGQVFPGVDLSVLEGVLDSMTFDKIVNMPEMQRFVDQDPYIAQKLRMGK